MKKLGIIGATGSIGRQAIDVIVRNNEANRTSDDKWDISFLSAHTDETLLAENASKVSAKKTFLTANGYDELSKYLEVEPLDMVLVGASGAGITQLVYNLAKCGTTIALANKECIVSAGSFIMSAARESGANVIPVDSEHSALLQCMLGHNRADIAELTMTASGGALRDMTASEIENVSPERALKHPNWSMGKKITIDSATLMNKGFELIEAKWLFDMPADKLKVALHPQSIVHALVSYKDGAIIAHLGVADMRIPISYALGYGLYGQRVESGVQPLNIAELGTLTFAKPDLSKYRCLKIALDVLNSGKNALAIVMNVADEVAVELFLNGKLKFNGIATLVENALNEATFCEPNSIDDVLYIDREVRARLNKISNGSKRQ
ncbi:1-deoxy-D-xylulose-5-phosphate reductoisomerase [Deferribacterales bacterium RsTz2092]|nr:1-deoxy-D-xylulose 5-phosphate reductoisomerase [Deferribacterales bacterium]